MSDTDTARDIDWPLRPWVLAALLGVAGLFVNWAMDWDGATQEPWRAALAAFAFFAPLLLAFTIDENRWKGPLGFAALGGLVMAGIAWRVARAEDHYADEQFWMAAGVVAMVLALPLFQAGFHKVRWRTSYEDTHFHVWTDAISAAGSFAFLGLSWALLALLSELFAAIRIDFLRDLMNKEWFGWLFSGVAFGAALGVLRNQLKILGTLQSVVMLVFSLVAVPFAFALVIFLVEPSPAQSESTKVLMFEVAFCNLKCCTERGLDLRYFPRRTNAAQDLSVGAAMNRESSLVEKAMSALSCARKLALATRLL